MTNKGPILAFTGVLAAGNGISSYLLLKDKDGAEPDPNALTSAEVGQSPETSSTDVPPVSENPDMADGNPATPDGPPLEVIPVTTDEPSVYMTDSVLISDLSGKLAEGDVTGFLALVGSDVATAEKTEQLRQLIVVNKYAIDPENPQIDLPSENENARIWGINMLAPESLSAVGDQQVRLGLTKATDAGWRVSSIEVPDVTAMVAAAGNPATAPPQPDPVTPESGPLDVADRFVAAVLAREFQDAKDLVNSEKVTDEKLAALFIVVEEGKFQKPEANPMMATAANDRHAWVIARLQAEDAATDFGLEIGRETPTDPWQVVALNYSNLIQDLAVASTGTGTSYEVFREDLQDGESLVLFFEYDDKQVNPRAARQLEVIARILREDPERQLFINGHADALGDEEYNVALSDSRARTVRETLLDLGVEDSQLVTQAFGEAAPKAPNLLPDGTDNPSGRAQNRRAEVYLKF